MNRATMQDERVAALRSRINSEAYGILMIALLASILVQQFLLNAPFAQYAAELICFFGMSLYILTRTMMLGLNIYGDTKRAGGIPFVSSLVTGLVVTAVNGVLNYAQHAQRYAADGIGYFAAVLVITFLSATAFAGIVLSLAGFLNRRRQATIQKRLDKAEQAE